MSLETLVDNTIRETLTIKRTRRSERRRSKLGLKDEHVEREENRGGEERRVKRVAVRG